jgi:hypothetical protein
MSSAIPGFAQDRDSLLYTMYNGSLAARTVLSMATAKIKPLIFSVSVFAFAYSANIFLLIILYELCLLPAQFCYTRINVLSWEAESLVQIADWRAPWKFSNRAETLCCGCCNFKSQVFATNSQAGQA